ncbi:MAG: carbon-nitrogen hydrolase family protein [Marinicaulis sp.]|nr:carbon-nitrogen hydrolase family protein [Marinicaulis sp.]
MTKYSVAAVQAAPMLFDPSETIERFAHWLGEAKAAGADLVVFPEAFLGGYPKGVDFGARVGSRNAAGRELFQRYFETSFDRAGDNFDRVRKLVSDAGVNVVVGVIEPAGGTLYCAAATLNRHGEITAWRRKLIPTAMERLIWGVGGGDDLSVANTDTGIVSAAICWENYMPLLRQNFYDQGTEFYCAPTVDDRPVWLPTMQMIALEGRCFVISASQFMTRGDVKDGVEYSAMQGDTDETVLINGGSCIISPLGNVIAEPKFGDAALIVAVIDKGEISRGKFDLDVSGHYARPDIFNLEIVKKK